MENALGLVKPELRNLRLDLLCPPSPNPAGCDFPVRFRKVNMLQGSQEIEDRTGPSKVTPIDIYFQALVAFIMTTRLKRKLGEIGVDTSSRKANENFCLVCELSLVSFNV